MNNSHDIPSSHRPEEAEKSLRRSLRILMELVAKYNHEIDLEAEMSEMDKVDIGDALELAFYYASKTYLPGGYTTLLERFATQLEEGSHEI